jgi:unsaturated rhamnogalacturonyl hydrolase
MLLPRAATITVRRLITCSLLAAGAPSIASVGALCPSIDWSKALVDSTLQRFSDPIALGSWAYPQALYLYGQYLVFKRTGDAGYLQYIKQWVDTHVDASGDIDASLNSLDNMLPGNLLLVLYQETGEIQYQLAADRIRRRFDTYPRTDDGGFWHATSRTSQLWLDGMYMSMPFLVRYGQMFGDDAYANDEAANQLLIYASHLEDATTGLLYHAYDELGVQSWADPDTHHSPEFWCRALGWYGMALIAVLDSLPADHERRPDVLAVLQNLVSGLATYQDTQTGLWYQVVDKGYLPANWHETSCSSMHAYTIYMAARNGYVDESYLDVALAGYQGVLSKISLGPDGLTYLVDISEGTNVGNLDYYLARHRNVNDLHGLGAFLIMNEQLQATQGR